LQQFEHFVVFREAPECFFREDQLSIDRHLEHATATRNEREFTDFGPEVTQ